MSMPKSLWVLTGVAVIAVAGFAAVLLGAPIPFIPGNTDGEVACTMEAKLCPDGVTYVGRSGPKCEFAACPPFTPPSDATTTVTARINQTVSVNPDIRITPLKVLEDSRCPLDVQCIQAGTVRLQAQVVDGMGTSTVIFVLNTPITLEARSVVLSKVDPAPYSKILRQPSDYLFTFSVEKR